MIILVDMDDTIPRIITQARFLECDFIVDLKDVVLIRRYLAEGWNVTLV